MFVVVVPDMPFGQVPVLEMDGLRLCGSIVICKYLARKYGTWQLRRVAISAIPFLYEYLQGRRRSVKHRLTYWGPATHMYVLEHWIVIDSGDSLSSIRCQVITWINDDLLTLAPLGPNSVKFYLNFLVKKVIWKCLRYDVFHFVQAPSVGTFGEHDKMIKQLTRYQLHKPMYGISHVTSVALGRFEWNFR